MHAGAWRGRRHERARRSADAPALRRIVLSEVDTETCGFPITNDETFASDVELFSDQDGNLDHSLAHIQLRGTDSANGVTLADDADWTQTYDFTTEINGDIGLAGRVLVPNGGAIMFEAGRVLSYDDGTVLFTAGRHEFMSGNLAAFCAALAG